MPSGKYLRLPPTKRFLAKTHRSPTGCLLWTGATNGNPPYGVFWFEGRLQGAHVVAWKLTGQVIPIGHQVLHKCDVALCVDHDHLFTGTQLDNMQDALQKGRYVASNSVLTMEQIAAVIVDQRPQAEIARDYGISQGHVSNLKNGRGRKLFDNQ